MRDPRRAYAVVDAFETELADYCNAPYAVTVDSATNGLFLCMTLCADHDHVTLPIRTYVGVLQAARNARKTVEWDHDPWRDWYRIWPTSVIDSARFLQHGMYQARTLTVLSMHAAKQLPLGRGGAILTDDAEAAEWLRAARMDGRPPGAPIEATQFPGFHCPMPPDTAARGLWILSRWNDVGYSPPPLPPEEYPDLSLLEARPAPVPDAIPDLGRPETRGWRR